MLPGTGSEAGHVLECDTGGDESLAGTRAAEVTSAALTSPPSHGLCLPRQVQRQISSMAMQPGRNSPVFHFCCSARGAGGWREGEVAPGFAHLRTKECVPCTQGTSQGENMFQELPPPLRRLRVSTGRAGSFPGSSSPGDSLLGGFGSQLWRGAQGTALMGGSSGDAAAEYATCKAAVSLKGSIPSSSWHGFPGR